MRLCHVWTTFKISGKSWHPDKVPSRRNQFNSIFHTWTKELNAFAGPDNLLLHLYASFRFANAYAVTACPQSKEGVFVIQETKVLP